MFSSARQRIKSLGWVKGCLLLLMAGCGLYMLISGPRPLDDAYITYRYARNIAQGDGFVYNLGEAVQGTTTPLYTLLLASLATFFGSENLPLISHLINLACEIPAIWLLFHLADHLLRDKKQALLLTAVYALQPFRLSTAVGGMETSCFILLILCMYWAYIVKKQMTLTAFLAGLILLTRLDGALIIIPLGIHAILTKRPGLPKAIVIGALTILPWFGWATWYFGNPIPFSILAKQAAYSNNGISWSIIFSATFLGTGTLGPYTQLVGIVPGLIAFLFLGVVNFKKFLTHSKEALIIIAYPLIYLAVMISQSAPIFFTWYYLPLMPGLLLYWFMGANWLIHKIGPQKRYSLLAGFSIILLVVPGLLMTLWPGWALQRTIEKEFFQMCAATSPKVRTGQMILAPDIGVIGWCHSSAKILDPIGLVSPESLPYLPERVNQELFSPRLIQDFQPDWIISREEFSGQFLDEAWFQADYTLVWPLEDDGDEITVYVFSR